MTNRKNDIKPKKLTDHITYRIIDNTIYLFQEKEDILDDELKTAFKKLSLMIDDYDIYYINISAKKIEDRKEFYQKLGFTLSYYDVNKLNKLYAGNKNKSLYKCYGIMTKKDFFDGMNESKKNEYSENKMIVSSNSGYVSNLLLLFGGIILLCYFCIEGAIYLVK